MPIPIESLGLTPRQILILREIANRANKSTHFDPPFIPAIVELNAIGFNTHVERGHCQGAPRIGQPNSDKTLVVAPNGELNIESHGLKLTPKVNYMEVGFPQLDDNNELNLLGLNLLEWVRKTFHQKNEEIKEETSWPKLPQEQIDNIHEYRGKSSRHGSVA